MNEKIKMFIACVVFALLSSCENFTSSLSGQVSSDTIKFSEFTVKIKNKDTNSSNWSDLGTLVIRKEVDGIATGLNVGRGYSSSFFSLEESEVNSFVKAMTGGGSFKTSLYYGYNNEQSDEKGIQNKEIITKIEKVNGSEYIIFSGDKIKDSGDKTAEYAISLEELKKNLK
ncbi:Erp family outer-surface lipoprotein (plasmid) [Borreliella japonica]|uniref:Erp family outer-surface lipoprotein n=1 Tax=Borreliella japonica TaxID=34095 RepID=UPI003AB7DD4D